MKDLLYVLKAHHSLPFLVWLMLEPHQPLPRDVTRLADHQSQWMGTRARDPTSAITWQLSQGMAWAPQEPCSSSVEYSIDSILAPKGAGEVTVPSFRGQGTGNPEQARLQDDPATGGVLSPRASIHTCRRPGRSAHQSGVSMLSVLCMKRLGSNKMFYLGTKGEYLFIYLFHILIGV